MAGQQVVSPPPRRFPGRIPGGLFLGLLLVIALGLFINQLAAPPAEPPLVPTQMAEATVPAVTSAPSIRLSPSSGTAGTVVTVAGYGWTSGAKIFVGLKDLGEESALQVYARVDANSADQFETSFIFPEDVAWISRPSVQIVAYSERATERATASFTLEEEPISTPTVQETVLVEPAETAEPAETTQPGGTATIVPGVATQPLPTVTPWWPTNTPYPTATMVFPTATSQPAGWSGAYYGNVLLAGRPLLIRSEGELNHSWGYGAPDGLPADNFSARWTRTLDLEAGSYRFSARSDDGVRLWLDGALLIDQWHSAGDMVYQAEAVASGGRHTLMVEYYEAGGTAAIQVWWDRPAVFADWRGEYWDNRSLNGLPTVVRNDTSINFDWGYGAPDGVPVDNFSARWTRTIWLDRGRYRFHARVDDGLRLYVDEVPLIDQWVDGAARELQADRTLSSGSHTVRVEYYEHQDRARVQVWWENVTDEFADWRAEYWGNQSLAGTPLLVRNDRAVSFDWGFGAPASGLPEDGFSTRWTRKLTFDDGWYRFSVRADDGVRVYVDGNRIVDHWQDSSGDRSQRAERQLDGQHTVVVEYYDNQYRALIDFSIARLGDRPTATPTVTTVPTASPTPSPSPTHAPTYTPVPATATATNTPVPPTATNTAVPATATATNTAVAPTATATSMPLPSATATRVVPERPLRLQINELLLLPRAVDWNGDGEVNAGDKWIELYNGNPFPVRLDGWVLQDLEGEQGSHQFSEGTVVAAGEYLVLFQEGSELQLDNRGEHLQLFDSRGVLQERLSFGALDADASHSLTPEGQWLSEWPPSPGRVNSPLGPA